MPALLPPPRARLPKAHQAGHPHDFAGALSGDGVQFDWAQFDSTQRTALLVTIVAAIAVISVADILGRAIAAGKAENARVQVMEVPRRARLRAGAEGTVVAYRPAPTPQVLFVRTDAPAAASWQNLDEVHLPPLELAA